MTCPEQYKYEIYYWWEKNPYRCARDTEPCSPWRVGWCKGNGTDRKRKEVADDYKAQITRAPEAV